MHEPADEVDGYLRDVSSRLAGSRGTRTRLLAELRDHLEDAKAAHVNAGMAGAEAERRALEQLGPAGSLAKAWEARCSRLRTRQRGRVAMLAGATAIAAVLGMTQHADGRRIPVGACVAKSAQPPTPAITSAGASYSSSRPRCATDR